MTSKYPDPIIQAQSNYIQPIPQKWDSAWNRWQLIQELLRHKSHLSVESVIKEAEKIVNFIDKEVA